MTNQHLTRYPELPSRRVDALGIETNYYTAGDPQAETIVLLHGMSTSGDSFRELMYELSEDYYLIAPDLPGFGYTENTSPYVIPHLVEWLAALFDVLELRPAHVTGHSFGGVLATSFALSYPEDVRSQILLAPALLTAQGFPNWMLELSKYDVSESVMGLGINASRVMLQRQLRAPFYNADRIDESVWSRREGDYTRSRASAAAIRAVALYDVVPELPRLAGPNCLIWGEQDSVVNPDGAPLLAEILPQAEYHLLPECGHAPQLEQTAQTAQIVRHFLPAAMQSQSTD